MTDFWHGRRTLITGISGFLGSHLAKALLERGAVVEGIDRVTDSPCLRVHGLQIPVFSRSVTNRDNIALQINHPHEGGRYSVIYHLAGLSHIAAAQQTPWEAINLNVMGTVNVLEACREYRDRGGELAAVVCSSSNHVYYGGTKGVPTPMREFDALLPTDLYGATKGAADLFVRAYAASFHLPVIALRHLNVYGPADPHASHIITGSILSLLRGEAPVIMSDGTPIKGYLYVEDGIAAYLRAAELAAEGACGAFNVGGPGQAVSVLALVRAIIAISGRDVAAKIFGTDLSQSGYVELLDDANFRTYGWRPRFSLHEGLQHTFNWYEQKGGDAWVKSSD